MNRAGSGPDRTVFRAVRTIARHAWDRFNRRHPRIILQDKFAAKMCGPYTGSTLVAVTFPEFIDLAGRVDNLLFAGKEWMTL